MATGGESNASFAIVRPDGEVWLVDAGPAVVERLLDVGLTPTAVTHVFVTHQHGDHLLGVPMLDNARWDADPSARMTIHGPRATLDSLRTVTLAVYPDHQDRFDRLIALHDHPADGFAAETVADATVRSAPARHGVPAVAYRFDLDELSVVFSGDTAPTEAVVELANDADLLVHDATFASGRRATNDTPDHSTPREAGQIAARARVARLALVHRPPESAGRDGELRREAAEGFGGEVVLPARGGELLR